MEKYYIAYGSNMDLDQMEFRCPNAELIGTSVVEGYELLFKGSMTGAYATIEKNADCKVPVLIWKIKDNDEANLDRYEGFPVFYYKKDIEVEIEGKNFTAMAYIMDERRKLGQPTKHYYGVLHKAYKRFGFDLAILKEAFEKSEERIGDRYVWGK